MNFKIRWFMSLFLCLFISFSEQAFSGRQLYEQLNSDPKNPFALSVGTSMSQTHQGENTANTSFAGKKMHAMIKKNNDLATTSGRQKASAWLKHKDRIWYALRSLPRYVCDKGHGIDPTSLNPETDAAKVDALLDAVVQASADMDASGLKLKHCPFCSSAVSAIAKSEALLTPVHKQALIAQMHSLHVHQQKGCVDGSLPDSRLSLEASDILKSGTDEIDEQKLQEQADFIRRAGNPLLFFHHYSNPAVKPNLFSDEKDADWFARYCAKVLEKSPHITHVCPISQPVGFGFRVARQTLPPFELAVDKKQYLKNMVQAHVKAAVAMRAVNPKVKILVSHQWKLMKPKHNSLKDPRYLVEKLIGSIADSMYNQEFVNLVKPYADTFDGIALSLYPPVYFNLWEAQGNNSSGALDEAAALEAIVETHNAFPDKDIYIVETGCNTQDSDKKREFIDMTLRVCKKARELGIAVKGVDFWGVTNDPVYYSEWGAAPGSTNFGPFDALDPDDPLQSINAAGKYIQDILKSE